jgi:hypothetical protein
MEGYVWEWARSSKVQMHAEGVLNSGAEGGIVDDAKRLQKPSFIDSSNLMG